MRRVAGTLAVLAAAVVAAALTARGTAADALIAIGIIVAPFAFGLAFARPFVFPFAAYVLVTPVNLLFTASPLATPAKLLGICAVFALLGHVAITKRVARPPLALGGWALLLVLAFASVMWAHDAQLSWGPLGRLASLLALTAAVAFTPATRSDVRIVFGACALGGVVCAIATLASYGRPGTFHDDRLWVSTDSTVDPNQVAAALLLPAVILIVTVARGGPWAQRAAALLGFVPIVVAIVLTGSRGAMVALCVTFAFLLAEPRYRRAALVVVPCALLAAAPLMPQIVERFALAAGTGGAGRTTIWRIGAAAMQRDADGLVGVGIGNFPNAYDASVLDVPQTLFEGWHRGPHSIFVSLAVELGLLGLACFAGAIALQVAAIRKIAATFTDERFICIAALGTVLVAGGFLDLLDRKALWTIFALTFMCRSAAFARRPLTLAETAAPPAARDASQAA